MCFFSKMKSYAQYYILQFSHLHFFIVTFLLNHIPLSEHATDYSWRWKSELFPKFKDSE